MLLATAGLRAQRPPPRDNDVKPTSGTASVSGVVVNDEQPPHPIRRAIVTLSGAGLTPSRSAITDDEGRFTLTNLPAGGFTLLVERATFVTSAYGAKRPGRPGTAIAVGAGQAVDNLVVKMWRGAVVAGTVRDESGTPVSGIPVSAVPARSAGGGGMLTLSNNGVRTDDRGAFRIFGLAPGTYVVSATPTAGGGGPLVALTDADVDAALDAVQRRMSGQSTGLAPASAPAPSAPPKPFDYAPVFFPGTASVTQATPLTLTPGQEIGGLDFSLQRVATAFIDGLVTRPDGSPAAGATVQLTAIVRAAAFAPDSPQELNTTARPDGTFRIAQVTPGDYKLLAKAPVRSPTAPQTTGGFVSVGNTEASVWAQTELSMAGTDVSGVTLQLEPGLTISGKLVFDGSTKPPADLTRFRVGLLPPGLPTRPNAPINSIAFVSPASVHADGTFDIINVLPGPYQLSVTVPAPGWWPQSAAFGDRDLLEGQTEITRGGTGLIVTLSDRRAELSGTLQAASGAAISDVFVIAYPADRKFWLPQARRVQAVRPDVSGHYLFASLPPGDYLLSAVSDVDQDAWQDPAFLDTLVTSSVKVTIGDGEKKTFDLQMGPR